MSLFGKFGCNYIAQLFGLNENARLDPEAPMRENHVGALYPAKAMDVVVAAEDDLVNDMVETYKEQREMLKAFKEKSFKTVEDFLDFAFEHYKVKRVKTNNDVLLMSFNQLRKITLTYSTYLTKTVEFNMAKQLIDEIKKEQEGQLNPISKALLEAFYTKKGDISVIGMIRLKNADIPHPRWAEVKELLNKALRPTGEKGYFRVYERESIDPKHNWQQISLDFSSL